MLDGGFPRGALNYWKSELHKAELSDDADPGRWSERSSSAAVADERGSCIEHIPRRGDARPDQRARPSPHAQRRRPTVMIVRMGQPADETAPGHRLGAGIV